MPKVTLATVLTELKKIESKNDERFELVKQEFQLVRSDMDQFRTGMDQFRSEMDQFRAEVNTRFDRVDESINDIAVQTASVTRQVSDHEGRIKKLERPDA